MKIIKITKTGLFYKVKFDNDIVYKFHESVIIAYGFIKKNIEVTQEKLNHALADNLYYLALDKGINYLATIRSKKEVMLYLKKYYDTEIVKKVVVKLEELKLINDLEYAKYYVSLGKKKHLGRYKIIQALKEVNVCEDYINEALNDYLNEEEIVNCEKVFFKYLSSLKKESRLGINKKITNHLLQKGFSNEIITIILENNREKLDNIVDEDQILLQLYKKLLKSKNKINDDKKFKNKVIRSLSAKGFPLYKILKLLEGEFDYD